MSKVKHAPSPISGILFPSAGLAYIACSGIPRVMHSVQAELAGALIGLGTVISALASFHSRIRSETTDPPISGSLETPLLDGPVATSPHNHQSIQSRPELSLLPLIIITACDTDYTSCATLIACLCTVGAIRLTVILAPVLIILVSLCYGFGILGEVKQYSEPFFLGSLVNTVGTYALDEWTGTHQSKLGFNIAAAAFLSLYIAISTLIGTP